MWAGRWTEGWEVWREAVTEREQSRELEALAVQVMVFRLKWTMEGSDDGGGPRRNPEGGDDVGEQM